MGRIPQYQRDRFASTHVGDPQLDTSGVDAVAGINAAVQPAVDIAAKEMHNREVIRIDQQANKALIDYSLAYQRRMKDLEREYADNPTAFPEAVGALGTELQTEYANAIPDERIKARFGEAAGSVVKQYSLNAFNWADAKEAANAYTAWAGSLGTAASVAAGASDTETFTATLGQISGIANSNPLVSPEKVLAMESQTVDEAIKGYMGAQLVNNPKQLWKDMQPGGKYDKLTYMSNGREVPVPLSPTDKQKYMELAEKQYLTYKADRDLKTALNAGGELAELAGRVDSGEAGLNELLFAKDRIYNRGKAKDKNGDPLTEATQEEKDAIDALIKVQVSTLAKSGKTDPYTLDSLNMKWVDLKDKIDELGDDPQKLTTDILKFQAEFSNAYADGKISSTDFNMFSRKISPTIMGAILEQNGQKGAWGFGKYHDEYGETYKFLRSEVESMRLSKDDKIKVRADSYRYFMQSVVSAEERGVELSKEQYRTLSINALRKAQTVFFPHVGEPAEKTRVVKGTTYYYTGLTADGIPNYDADNAVQNAAKMKR